MSKNKKRKITIKGLILVGICRDVDFYYSRVQNKFVDDVMKLTVGDLMTKSDKQTTDLNQIKTDYPLVDSIKGWAKIKIKIEL
jgi:hypothetical protein